MSDALRVALAGFGYWGPNLARNLHDTDGLRLVAIADPQPERRARAARQYQGVDVVEDACQLTERADVDALVVATPLSTHFSLAKRAMERGKHVLIEKPMASNVREAEALAELAHRQRVRLMVDHTFVYTGAVRKLKELVLSGQLGDLLYLDSVRVNLGLFQHDTNVIWDLAPHDLSIMDYLIEERPVSVSAHGAAVDGFEHESIAYLTVHFRSGFLGHFHVNWMAPVKIRRMLLGGRRKMVTFDDLEPSEKVRIYDSGVSFDDVTDDEARRRVLISYRTGDVHAPRLERQEALAAITREFADAISEGREPVTGAGAGVRVVKMLEAAEQSLRADGRKVML